MSDTLRVAAWTWSAASDARANAAAVRHAMDAAHAAGARVLVTPECVLTGYPSAARPDLSGIDWCAVAEHEESLLLHAERLGMLLALGTASPDGSGGIRNELVAGGACDPVRRAKHRLTPIDERHFTPGPAGAAPVRAFGWTFGLSICFEVRFPGIFRAQAAAGADAFLHAAHMAGPDPDPGTKAAVIPALYAARAAEWATPLVLANTGDPDRYLPSAIWDARGVRSVCDGGPGLIVHDLARREAWDPWYGRLRDAALAT